MSTFLFAGSKTNLQLCNVRNLKLSVWQKFIFHVIRSTGSKKTQFHRKLNFLFAKQANAKKPKTFLLTNKVKGATFLGEINGNYFLSSRAEDFVVYLWISLINHLGVSLYL